MIVRLPAFAVSSLLVSSLIWGQAPAEPPAEPGVTVEPAVEDALRERVNEFFQYHVDGGGALMKAFAMVAEDTKEEYFAAAKMQLTAFKSNEFEFTDPTHALVTTTVTRMWGFHGQESEVTVPMVTTWKVEDGEWRWYHDVRNDAVTPMGPSNREANEELLITKNEDGSVNLPKDFSPETVAAAAQAIFQKSTVDRETVTLSSTEVSEEEILFHNGNFGYVGFGIEGLPEIPGLTATVDKTMLGGQENAVVRVRYEPAPPEEGVEPKKLQPFQLRLVVTPFNQVFPVIVRFAAE